MYRLLFFESKVLIQDRKRLIKDKIVLGFVEEALGRLALNPFAGGLAVKKLRNSEEGTFRLRCGKWRVIFDVDASNRNIIIYRIKQRKEGY